MTLDAPLCDDGLIIERLEERHRDALRAACAEDGEVWAIYSISFAPDRFDASFDALMARERSIPFAILIDAKLGGMSAFLGIDMDRETLEIGNTYYRPVLRGGGLNERVKRLMIARAFEQGFRRIEFRVDIRNARSQAAMAKIGSVREGVLRADRVTWTGHVRDTALFSILASEWRG